MMWSFSGETGAAESSSFSYHAGRPDYSLVCRISWWLARPAAPEMVRLLFPSLPLDPSTWTLRRLNVEDTHVSIILKSTARTACCPLCQQPADRVHSHYIRRLADLPLQDRVVRLQVEVRRFFCPVADCPRRIFAERLDSLAMPFARTTLRLRGTHCAIGFALGGEAGARLAKRLAMPTSPDTILRHVRTAPLPPQPAVRILGVDDWAFRKGHHYGTILCDLERRCPVDLLAERSAEALSAWLKNHPEVEIISRDRADDYIRGATAGAPQATQVADRWHLLRNLRDALMDVVDRHHVDVRAAAREALTGRVAPASSATLKNESAPPSVELPPAPTLRTQRQQLRRLRRQQCYEEVLELNRQGLSHRAIADRLEIDRGTVRRFVNAGTFPERATRRYTRRTDRFAGYLKQRWAEGCRNAAQLYEELKMQGFAGSYHTVRRQLARWRQAMPPNSEGVGKAAAVLFKRPSARRVSWLLLKDQTELQSEEQVLIARLEERCPELCTAAKVAQEFRRMVRERREEGWEPWLAHAREQTAPKELRTFAEGLKRDEPAVRAALRLPWSNGQVEGQVNRLKLIKRQMFGRAKFDLLRQRVLHAS
jgi:transposase